jgi:hypothetical protein
MESGRFSLGICYEHEQSSTEPGQSYLTPTHGGISETWPPRGTVDARQELRTNRDRSGRQYSPALLDRLAALESDKANLQLEMVSGPAPIVRLHPAVADVYAAKVTRLKDALSTSRRSATKRMSCCVRLSNEWNCAPVKKTADAGRA